jgi:sigma-E factor negative regulatory protein RseC
LASEEGIVIRTVRQTAWIKTHRSSACESCSSRDACSTMGGGKEMEVEALNPIGAAPGDRVLIRFDTGKLMGISFFIYIFPILLLIVGAIVGQKIAPILGMNPSVASALAGFALFGVAFLLVRWGSGSFVKKEGYQPSISRIVSRAGDLPLVEGGGRDGSDQG